MNGKGKEKETKSGEEAIENNQNKEQEKRIKAWLHYRFKEEIKNTKKDK